MRTDYTRLELWERRIAEWQSAGKNGKAWCREQEIPYQTFLYWRSKIKENKRDSSICCLSSSSFTELPDQISESAGVELLCNEVTIRLSKTFDQQTLRLCLQTLRTG